MMDLISCAYTKKNPPTETLTDKTEKGKKHKIKVWCNGFPSPVTNENAVTTKPLAKKSTH